MKSKTVLEVEPFKMQAVDLGVSAYVGETNFVDITARFGAIAGVMRLTMDHDRFLAFACKVAEEAQKVIQYKQRELANLKRADKVLARMAKNKLNRGSTGKGKRK